MASMPMEKNPDKKIKLIFAGTSDFGVPSLEALGKALEFEVLEVISQPDKKSGRNLISMLTAVKKTALDLGLPVEQPENIKSIKEHMQKLKPDLIVVAAYAQLIPGEIMAIPKYGCINIHASLLPKYRGSACVQAAILNGDSESGITIMKMDENLDTGDILKQFPAPISASDTAGDLFGRLSALAGKIICSAIIDYIEGRIKPARQPASAPGYAKKLRKQDGRIDWKNPAEYIERFIRAMQPWPGAYAFTGGKKMIKFLSAGANPLKINRYHPGLLFRHENCLAVQCGKNALQIKQIQIQGKKPLAAKAFLCGYAKSLPWQLG